MNTRADFSLRAKIVATAVAVALATALGAVDYLTGREWAVSAFYLCQAVSLLNQFMHVIVEVVENKHGGMINKFLGDGFLALFGVGEFGHNHADKALGAARDLEYRLERLNRELSSRGEEPLQIGIGINSGPAIVGSIGSSERMEFTVIGNMVNVASHIETLNKTVGTTLLFSKATRDALRRPVPFRALPHQTVDGIEGPLEIFTLDYAWA